MKTMYGDWKDGLGIKNACSLTEDPGLFPSTSVG